MTVRLYTSEDLNAPQLTKTIGSLIPLLDAVLVTGYGDKVSAGWSKPFSGTNKAVYAPNKLTHEIQPYFRVNDSVATTYAELAGFREMWSVDAGNHRFPSSSSIRNIMKHDGVGTGLRRWKVLADERTAYIMTQPSTLPDWEFSMIGAFHSYRPLDPCPYIAESVVDSATTFGTNYAVKLNGAMDVFSYPIGIAIGYSGKGGVVTCGFHTDYIKAGNPIYMGTKTDGTSGMADINPADGAIYFTPIWIHEPQRTLRGTLRGMLNPLMHLGLSEEMVINGTRQYPGKTLLAMQFRHAEQCQIAFETSDTWEL